VVQQKVKHPPKLPTMVAEELKRAIVDGTYQPAQQLPSEPELARAFGVSRTTLRQGISLLEQEGIITRRHGLGTFIASKGSILRNNINSNFGVTDLIESSGWRPGTRRLQVHEEVADAHTLELLALPPGSKVIIVDRTRTADDRPVVFTIDILPKSLLVEYGIDPTKVVDFVKSNESLYRTLESIGVIIHHGVAELIPMRVTKELATNLEVSLGELLLHIEQVDYTSQGEAVLLSHEYHVANAFSISVYRKGPGNRI
jgi:GntR family transcriptional regulator